MNPFLGPPYAHLLKGVLIDAMLIWSDPVAISSLLCARVTEWDAWRWRHYLATLFLFPFWGYI